MKAIDMNVLANNTIPFTFQDAKKTTIRLKTPSLELVKSIGVIAENLKETLNGDDDAEQKAETALELIAVILSYNIEGKKFTAKELTEKYNFDIISAGAFLNAYAEIIAELNNTKN